MRIRFHCGAEIEYDKDEYTVYPGKAQQNQSGAMIREFMNTHEKCDREGFKETTTQDFPVPTDKGIRPGETTRHRHTA